MYYAWVIRHLPDKPYTIPEFTEEHRWTLEPVPILAADATAWVTASTTSTSSASAAPPSISTASRSAAGSRTWPASPNISAAARPTSPSERLGWASPAMLTRVGDEHMGRFVREHCAREGVDVRHVKTDPQRLTALVVLGIRDREHYPHIFYRENCADMAIEAGDIDEA